jgi:hypothetical protein
MYRKFPLSLLLSVAFGGGTHRPDSGEFRSSSFIHIQFYLEKFWQFSPLGPAFAPVPLPRRWRLEERLYSCKINEGKNVLSYRLIN